MLLTVRSMATEVLQAEKDWSRDGDPEAGHHQSLHSLHPELSLTANLQAVEGAEYKQQSSLFFIMIGENVHSYFRSWLS